MLGPSIEEEVGTHKQPSDFGLVERIHPVIVVAIYSGNDNRYFLERNIQPLRDWVCAADWLALEGLFGPCYCFFCDIKEDSRWEQTDPNKKRWTMKNPDEVLPGALLHVRQRNIRICGLHSGKRLFSILCDCLLEKWSNMTKEKNETDSELAKRKTKQQIGWELFGTSIGLGNSYSIALSKKLKAKPGERV